MTHIRLATSNTLPAWTGDALEALQSLKAAVREIDRAMTFGPDPTRTKAVSEISVRAATAALNLRAASVRP